MKITCSVIQDLLPLYHDGVCCEESRKIVEDHLETCESCRICLDEIADTIFEKSKETKEDKAKIHAYQSIKKKLFHKKVIVSTVSVLCTMAITVSTYLFLFHYTIPIEYVDGLIEVHSWDDDNVFIQYNGDQYNRIDMYSFVTEKDGVLKTELCIYFSDSIWTKYIAKGQKNEGTLFHFGLNDYGNEEDGSWSGDRIDRIYYYPFENDLYHQKDPEGREVQLRDEILERSVLIWSR